MDEKQLSAIADAMNAVPNTAKRTNRHMAQIQDTNDRIMTAANSLLRFDSSPVSFATFKAECPRGRDSLS